MYIFITIEVVYWSRESIDANWPIRSRYVYLSKWAFFCCWLTWLNELWNLSTIYYTIAIGRNHFLPFVLRHSVCNFFFQLCHFQMFHIGQKCAPHHTEETRADHLITDGNDDKIKRLHDRPVDDAHTISTEKLVSDLQSTKQLH